MRTLCPGWAGQLSRRGVNLYWSSIRSPWISIPGPVRDTDRSQALTKSARLRIRARARPPRANLGKQHVTGEHPADDRGRGRLVAGDGAEANGETVITRYTLRALLDKLDELVAG